MQLFGVVFCFINPISVIDGSAVCNSLSNCLLTSDEESVMQEAEAGGSCELGASLVYIPSSKQKTKKNILSSHHD